MIDPITEECRRVRDEIVKRAGGFEGYFNQLEALDRKRLTAETKKQKSPKTPVTSPRPRDRKPLA